MPSSVLLLFYFISAFLYPPLEMNELGYETAFQHLPNSFAMSSVFKQD
jgi:hypothetical protein